MTLTFSDIMQQSAKANWTEVDEASGYTLELCPDTSFQSFNTYVTSASPGSTVETTLTTWRAGSTRGLETLEPSRNYYVRIRAYLIVGGQNVANSPWSAATRFRTAAPPPLGTPGTPAFSNIGQTSVRVDWTRPANAAGQEIQFLTGPLSSLVLAARLTVGGTASFGTVTGLTSDTTYFVRIKAWNDFAIGHRLRDETFSTGRYVTTASSTIPVPGRPGRPTIDEITENSARATFTAGTGATAHQLIVATNSTFTQGVVSYSGDPDGTAIQRLSDDTQYWVRVRGVNAGGNGPWSQSRSFRTAEAVPPPVPGNPTIDQIMDTSARVMFGASVGATSYRLVIATNSAFTQGTRSFTGTPTGTNLTGLASNTTYYVRVQAVNAHGSSNWTSWRSFTTTLPLPGRAGRPTISQIAQTTAHAIFTAATGATGHEVQVATNSSFSQGVIDFTGTPTGTSLNGLTSNTLYYVRARGTNSAGAGTWSQTRSFRTLIDLPGAVTGLSIDNITHNAARAQFTAATDATSHQIQIATNNTFTQGLRTITANPLGTNITSLSLDTLYYVRARGRNAGGNGPWTTSQSFRTAARAIVLPGRAGTPTVRNITEDSADASWSAASNAIGYTVEISTSSTFDADDQVGQFSRSVTNVSFSGLSPNTLYYVRVYGWNLDGDGPWSGSRSFRTLQALPETPTSLAIDTIKNVSARAIFTAGEHATSHRLQIATNSEFTQGVRTFTGNPLGTNITGLRAETLYYVRVQGINTRGRSDWSFTETFTTAQNPPTARPTLVISGIDADRATGGWDLVERAEGYKLQLSRFSNFASPTEVDTINTSTTITGLLPLTRYYARVRAENASGNGPWSSRQTFVTLEAGNVEWEFRAAPSYPVDWLFRAHPTYPVSWEFEALPRPEQTDPPSFSNITTNSVRVFWPELPNYEGLYDVDIAPSSNFFTGLRRFARFGGTVTIRSLTTNTLYYVRVRPRGGDWSDTSTFKTLANVGWTFESDPGYKEVSWTYQATPPVYLEVEWEFIAIMALPQPVLWAFDAIQPPPEPEPIGDAVLWYFESVPMVPEPLLPVSWYFQALPTLPPPSKSVAWDFESFPMVPDAVAWFFQATITIPVPPEPVAWFFSSTPTEPIPTVPVSWEFVSGAKLPLEVSWIYQAAPMVRYAVAWEFLSKRTEVSWDFRATPQEHKVVAWTFQAAPFPTKVVAWEFQAVEFVPEEVEWFFESVPQGQLMVSWEAMFTTIAESVSVTFTASLAPRHGVDVIFSAYGDLRLPAPLITDLVPPHLEALDVPVERSDTRAHIHLGAGISNAAITANNNRRIYLTHGDGRFAVGSNTHYILNRSLTAMYRIWLNPNCPDGESVNILVVSRGATVRVTLDQGRYHVFLNEERDDQNNPAFHIFEREELLFLEVEISDAGGLHAKVRAYDYDFLRVEFNAGEPLRGHRTPIPGLAQASEGVSWIDADARPLLSVINRVEWWRSDDHAYADWTYYVGPWDDEAGLALPGPTLHPMGQTELTIENSRDSSISQSPPTVPTMSAIVFDHNDYLVRYLHTDRWPLHMTMARCAVVFENSGVYEAPFMGILNTPTYLNDDTHKMMRVSAMGMSSLLTQNARLNHPKLFGPSDEMTTGKVIVEATRNYCRVHGLELNDVLADDPAVIESDFEVPLAFWWQSNENLWSIYARAIATQGPPATYWETGLGKIRFWSGKRSRRSAINVGGPPPGEIAFEPVIEGEIMITDHIADVANDALIPVSAKGFITPENLVYDNMGNPRPHIPEWYDVSARVEQVNTELENHKHSSDGPPPVLSAVPMPIPVPVPHPDSAARKDDQGVYPHQNQPVGTAPPAPSTPLSPYTPEEIINGDNLLPVVLWSNIPEIDLHKLAGISRNIPDGDSVRYQYSHSEPFRNEELKINPAGSSDYSPGLEGAVGTPVSYTGEIIRLSATSVEIVVTHSHPGPAPVPIVLLLGTPLRSLGVVNYYTSPSVRGDARTIASRQLYRYRQFEYAGFTSIYPAEADKLADWVVEYYRDGIKTMALKTYVQGFASRFQEVMRLVNQQRVDVYHPDYYDSHGRFRMLVRSVQQKIIGPHHHVMLTLDEDPELRSVNPVGKSPMLR